MINDGINSKRLAEFLFEKCRGLYFCFAGNGVTTKLSAGASSFMIEDPIFEGNKRIGKVVYEVKIEATTYLE